VGNTDLARAKIMQARQLIMTYHGSEFSAWRYLKVSSQEFVAGLDATLDMINGGNKLPMFMMQNEDELK
jgi:hypothetical protein